MQQQSLSTTTRSAGVGQRFLAVFVDTSLVIILSALLLSVAVVLGVVNLDFLSANSLAEAIESSRAAPRWLIIAEHLVMLAYFTLFELRGATPGKRLFRLVVVKDDGTPITPAAAIIRNLFRIPETLLYYIPSVFSMLLMPGRKRIGDIFAQTIVIYRDPAAATHLQERLPEDDSTELDRLTELIDDATRASPTLEEQGRYATLPPLFPPHGTISRPQLTPDADVILALKTATLALYGAHHRYLLHSHIELTRAKHKEEEPATLAPLDDAEEPSSGYSTAYVNAWETLTESVKTFQQAFAISRQLLERDPDEAAADEADLKLLLSELRPYLFANSDELIYETCLRVAHDAR